MTYLLYIRKSIIEFEVTFGRKPSCIKIPFFRRRELVKELEKNWEAFKIVNKANTTQIMGISVIWTNGLLIELQ